MKKWYDAGCNLAHACCSANGVAYNWNATRDSSEPIPSLLCLDIFEEGYDVLAGYVDLFSHHFIDEKTAKEL